VVVKFVELIELGVFLFLLNVDILLINDSPTFFFHIKEFSDGVL